LIKSGSVGGAFQKRSHVLLEKRSHSTFQLFQVVVIDQAPICHAHTRENSYVLICALQNLCVLGIITILIPQGLALRADE